MKQLSRSRKSNKKKPQGKKWVIISVITIVTLLAASYFAGVFFYSSRVLNTVVFNDENTGITQYSDVDSYVKKVISEKNLVIKTADSKENFSIPLKTLNPEYSINEINEHLKSQMSPWKWPVQLFFKKDVGLNVYLSIDSSLLKQRLTALGLFDNSNRVETKDATITVADTGLTIKAPEKGTQLDAEATFKKIKDELDQGKVTIDVSECTVPPITSEKDLEKLRQDAQKYVDTPISLTLGQTKQVLTSKQKASMLAIDEKAKKVTVSDELVASVLTEINDQYAKSQGGTSAESRVTFGNGEAKLVSSATSVLIMNVANEVPKVKAAFEKKQALDYAPVVKENATGVYTYKNKTGDITKVSRHFVEVSIPQQKLWVYEGGTVVLSADIVTGMESPAKNTPTVRGLFQILSKEQGTILRGSTVGYTGAQDYKVRVNYWIPFERSGYGFHDAEGWKPYDRYGGTYYKTEGSHGCVNMRNKDVKVLFETAATGTPVWVHE